MLILRGILLILAGLLCLTVLFVFPTNKYEWMLAEDPRMVLPIDHNADIYPILAIFPVVAFFLMTLFVRDKIERWTCFSGQFALTVFWAYKFWRA